MKLTTDRHQGISVVRINEARLMYPLLSEFANTVSSLIASGEQKVLLDLGCSSHNAMWERNHLILFRASLEWLTSGTVQGMKTGIVKLGY